MRLKDITEFCPAYTGAARNDTVAFVPMEALRYDCITQQDAADYRLFSPRHHVIYAGGRFLFIS